MLLSQDMKDLLELFGKHRVQYALVGGYAVNLYGYSRATQDLDLLIYPSTSNALRVMAALEEFGFGEARIPQEFFEKPGSAVHLGVEPNRIDLLTTLGSLDNEQIFSNLEPGHLGDMQVAVISLPDLIEVKKRSNRLKDQADAEELQRLGNHRRGKRSSTN